MVTRQSKKVSLIQCKLGSSRDNCIESFNHPLPNIITPMFLWAMFNFQQLKTRPHAFKICHFGLPWASKYLMITNWTNFLLLYAKSWLTRCWKIKVVGIWVVIQSTSTTFNPNIFIDEFNKQAYMFLNLEKEKSHNDSMVSFKTTKESLLSTSTCSQCHPKKNF